MADQKEIRNRRWGAVVSLGVHLALLLLFFFVLAWKEPNPPLPQYGIELNFGLEAAGSGDVQPDFPALQSDLESESETESTESQESEDSESEPETTDSEQMPEEVSPAIADPTQAVEDLQPIESPDVNPVQEVNPQNTDLETPQPTQPEAEPNQVQAETESTSSAVESDSDNPEQATQSNQGDRLDEVGDQGDPEGSLDARALYGNAGGGDGAALNLTGWAWDFIPKPRDPSEENGRIVFEIVIDDEGDLISVRTLEKTVSPNIEKIYKAEVEKLTFSPTTQNTLPAHRSTGTITFIIRSR